MKIAFLLVGLALSSNAFATKPCEELKVEIAAKFKANKVEEVTIDIVPADKETTAKVVGTCERGSKKIVYVKK